MYFGSNEGGHHGAGAARTAHALHGAKMGLAFGYVGNSFAIPTKDKYIRNTLSLPQIEKYVNAFIWQASGNGPFGRELKDKKFQVTRLGCGLAKLSDADIAPMFRFAPDNCLFDEKWRPFLGDNREYWGTY